MKDSKRIIRKEKLAKLFYEMGMDIDVVSKVSGVDKKRLEKIVNRGAL